MKRVALLAVLVAGTTSAGAVVQIFFTSSSKPYGLANPANAFNASVGTQDVSSGAYQVAAFPPLTEGPDFELIAPPLGEFVYVWLRFVDEPLNARIQGVHLGLSAFPTDVAYYVVDDTNGSLGAKRWDGAKGITPPAPAFKSDPQTLAAVSAAGIVNSTNATSAWNLYDPGTRTALLGAVSISDGPHQWQYTYGTHLMMYASGQAPQVQVGSFGIPEPASLLVWGGALAFVRRLR